MEEKERYECKYDEKLMKHYAFDNENKEELGYTGVVRVLNEQNKRIKELEEENKFLEKRNEELTIDRRDLCLERNDLFEENQQLKQSQKQIAISELEKLKSAILSERNTTYFKFDNFNKGKDTAYYWANEIIDNQIKSLRGEE